MTKDEAAIVSAYTGFLLCTMDELLMYATKTMGYYVDRNNLQSPVFEARLKIASYNDFVNLEVK